MSYSKLKIPSEIAYIIDLSLLSLGTCLMAKADFGMSMIAAPAYLLNQLLTKTVSSFFTFGIRLIYFLLGHFEGINIGTVFIALVNGTTIGIATKIIDRFCNFYDLLDLKKLFG